MEEGAWPPIALGCRCCSSHLTALGRAPHPRPAQISILSGTLARLDRDAPHYSRKGFNDFNTFYLQAASGGRAGGSRAGKGLLGWRERGGGGSVCSAAFVAGVQPRHSLSQQLTPPSTLLPRLPTWTGTKGGSSGSPVVDVRGQAVGLNAGGRTRGQQGYYLPLHRVVRALRLLQVSSAALRGRGY